MYNPPDTTSVMVRQIYEDWSTEYPGDVHIDRVGYVGKVKPPPSAREVAQRLRDAAEKVYSAATFWPKFVRIHYMDGENNALSDPYPAYKYGGPKGRWYSNTYFSIPEGKALVLKTWPTSAEYQGIQLTDCYFASREYANRITSLNTEQSVRAPDGAFYYVVSPKDPGYVNWLDTAGLREGVILLRYDGVNGDIPKEKWPSSRLVDVDDLSQVIPGFEQDQASAEERTETISKRRQHIQIRFHR